MGKKGDLSNFERGMVIGARQASLEYFTICSVNGIFTHNYF